MALNNRTKYALTTDCVIFGYANEGLYVALIERKNTPYKGKWALPGGFLEGNETVEETALRELKEETGINNVHLQQVGVYSDPDRDPRGRIITVAFFALVTRDALELVASEDATKAKWWPINATPKLAFDHQLILNEALAKLRKEIKLGPAIFSLLGSSFTLSELQKVVETIMGQTFDKRSFRKKILSNPFIVNTNKKVTGQTYRPAQLYSFDKKNYLKQQNIYQTNFLNIT